MLYYNTAQPHLSLPEYGRNIQHMVDFCITLTDKEQRTACAYAIVETMARLFPNLKGENDDMSKFWDHINIMSGFKLDVDFPCEVMQQEQLNPKPAKIPYNSSRFRHRHYGKLIEQMIGKVSELEESPEKAELVSRLAHHLKKLMLAHNPEAMTDAKILKDLSEFSGGNILLNPDEYVLHDFTMVATPANKKKKKK